MQNDNELNILICGSQRFDDKSFVFGMLDAFYKQGPDITNIITSRFSGACQFATEWVEIVNQKFDANIGLKNCEFDFFLEAKNLSLYEQMVIPDFIMQEDPFFQKGKEKLMESGVKAILAFPNPEGQLGAATLNIQRFAQLAGIGNCFMDCSQALSLITEYRQQYDSEILTPQDSVLVQGDQLKNRHPSKKF